MARAAVETAAARALALAFAAVCWAALCAVAASAQDTLRSSQDSLRSALLRNQVSHEAALYETVDGVHAFVLDRTGDPPLLRFERSFEVFALTSVPAARGDELLRTDTGRDLVRVTTLGSVTLYPVEKPTGMPAAKVRSVDPLPMLADMRLNVVDAFRSLRVSAGRAEVDAPVSQASEVAANALLADAARLTAAGLGAAADGAGEMLAFRRIAFVFGAGADARLEDGVLVVQLDLERGYAGRPSSLKVAEAVTGG
jgi:hypothetical protein